MGRRGRANGRRYRRRARRGRMLPAEATKISTRTRSVWPRTKTGRRYYPRAVRWASKDIKANDEQEQAA